MRSAALARSLTAAALTLSTLGVGSCGVRTGGTIATVSASAEAPSWPERHGTDVAVDLAEASEGVRLVTRRSGRCSHLLELEHPSSRDSRAVVTIPAIGTTLEIDWPAMSPDGGRVVERSFLYVAPSEESRIGRERSGERRMLKVTFTFPRFRALVSHEPVDAPPRGLCVALPSIVGATSIERELVPLVDAGWTVVTFDLHDFVRPYRVGAKAQLHRGGAGDLGRLLADELADSAFAVELMVRQLVEEDPRRASLPLVLVGTSLGAIELPACAAYLAAAPQPMPPLRGAVLIGGGAGIDQIMLDGSLGREWLRALGAQLPSDSEESAWRQSFAATCTLAPERCLYALNGIPVLLLDARFDSIVPRATADRLWELLGQPQRWSYPFDHFGLFLLLSSGTWTEVREWINATSQPVANDVSR